MIEDIADKITDWQIKKPWTIITIFLIVSLLVIPGIFNLINNVEPSLEKVLPSDIEEVKTMNDMRAQFGADMMYLIVHIDAPIQDVRNPEFIKYIDILSQKLRNREGILEVRNIADIIKLKNNNVIPDSENEIKQILKGNKNYVNDELSFTVIEIRTDTGSSAKKIKEIVTDIKYDIQTLEDYNPGSSVKITGFNAIDKATFEVIISDFGFITAISMILIMIVVLITFRSLSKGMMPMVVVMNALIMTMGISGYLNLTITVVSMVAAAMIMGLGIDFGIHVVHSYYDLREKKSKEESLNETVKELLRAMLAASLTTTAGFLALLFGVLPAMKTLGIILGIGIINTLIGAVFLLPAIIYIYDRRFGK